MKDRLIFIDLETTGPNPRRHPIMQLAAIAVDETLTPVETIEFKLRFREQDATRRSLHKLHYSRGLWAREALPSQVAAATFAAFLRRHSYPQQPTHRGGAYGLAQLVAHNAAFDGAFLQAWYEELGLFLPARYQLFCTLQRAHWYFSERPHLPRPASFRLATLCQYFDVPFHAADAHDALGDVTATVDLYRALVSSARKTRRHAA